MNIKWVYNKKDKSWNIGDKFGAFGFVGYKKKPEWPVIDFCGKKMILFPVHCEFTGKQLGWRSTVPTSCKNKEVFPAFFTTKCVASIRRKRAK